MGVFSYLAERFGYQKPTKGTIARIIERGLANHPRTPYWDVKRFADEGYRRNVLVFACVKLRGRSAGQVKFIAKSKNKTGDLEPLADAHPLQKLMVQPNAEQSQREFVQHAWLHRDVGGADYIHKVRARAGNVVEMWLLRPDRTQPVPDEMGFIQAYDFPTDQAKRIRIPSEDVVFYPEQDYLDDYYGISKIAVLARQGDVDNESAEYMRSVLLNAGVPVGALKVKSEVPIGKAHRDAMRQEWRDIYGRGQSANRSWLGMFGEPMSTGSSGHGDIAVMDADVDYIRLGSPFNEMDLNGIFSHTETRICAAFGVPAMLVGAKAGIDRSTFSNSEQAEDNFWNQTMVPECWDFASKLTTEVAPEFGENLVIEPDFSQIRALQEDADKRAERALKGWEAGVVRFDELRIRLGEDAVGSETVDIDEEGTQQITDIGEKFKWQLPVGGGTDSKKAADEAPALMAQRLYLPVNSEQPLLSPEEAREMINKAGGNLSGPPPKPKPPPPSPFGNPFDKKKSPGEGDDTEERDPEAPPEDEVETEEQGISYDTILRLRRDLPKWYDPVRADEEWLKQINRTIEKHAKRPAYKRLHDACDDKALSIRRCVSKGFRLSKEAIDIQSLANALFVKDSMRAEELALGAFRANGVPVIKKTMCSALGSLYRSGAKAGVRDTREKQGIGPKETFAGPDLDPGEDASFAETRVAELVTDVSEATRSIIRQHVEGMFNDGYSARRAATRIRETIGLTTQGLRRLQRFEERQRENGITGEVLDGRISKFTRKLIRERALTIARTEGIRAVSEGQSSIWKHATEMGILPQDQEIFWITTEDERTCEICAPMDGQTIKVGEEFQMGGGGTVDAPPAHPNCRCARGLK